MKVELIKTCLRRISILPCRYQADVPEFDASQSPQRYDVADIHRQCTPIPDNVLFLHRSAVFLPEYVEGSKEQSVSDR